jgi:putative membrane protein
MSKIVKRDDAAVKRSLAKGMLAGLIGGVAAMAAKTIAERAYSQRPHEETEQRSGLRKLLPGGGHHELAVREKTATEEAIHWGFGAVAGAAYGGVAEYFPAVTAKDGAKFGLTLATLTSEASLPGMRFFMRSKEQSPLERASGMATHVVYGLITETVRRVVRKQLG